MIWVIGCNGMLGTELCRCLSEKHIAFIGSDRNVDITDFAALDAFARSLAEEGKPVTAVVNCAAYTAVDKAESELELAQRLNGTAPGNIARLTKLLGERGGKVVPLVHISTDYVFDGSGGRDSSGGLRPYVETDAVSPLGAYGSTKAAGEQAVAEETDAFYILRTAWLYGWAGKNFVYTMIRAMKSRDSVKVVADQRGTPTFCGTLASVIIQILERAACGAEHTAAAGTATAAVAGAAAGNSSAAAPLSADGRPEPLPYGVYHVTDEGKTTWYDFTREIQKQAAAIGLLAGSSCAVNACTTADYPTPARRPAYSVLSKEKIQTALGIRLPQWQETLGLFLKSPLFDRNRLL